ncbi:hypothetical protein D9758_012276 [Tetrapyrgos nigripes]|uniref:Carboxylesterase type B domain-containing protein n=1 Tax=Tetrapyrgos nigripes TaxID=182062 RepID=A0A8H5CGR3_9AGAR|nr:hypothetical protein D9758_012276 [Tetrapyrgos nigripes]
MPSISTLLLTSSTLQVVSRPDFNESFHNTVSYLGIPYTVPPLGKFRFRNPVPLDQNRISHETGGGIVNATEYPDFCVQGSTTIFQGPIGSNIQRQYPGLDDSDIEDFEANYPLSDFDSELQRLTKVTGESFRCAPPIIGNETQQRKSTRLGWLYRYDQPNLAANSSDPDFAGHAAKNWMMFRCINTG